MANIYEPTEQQVSEWDQWVAKKDDRVRVVAEKVFPWKLYRLKSSGHRVIVHSIDEPVEGPCTLKVIVSGEFNAVMFERTVFGVHVEDLEECDLPSPTETLGSLDVPIEVVKEMMKKDEP